MLSVLHFYSALHVSVENKVTIKSIACQEMLYGCPSFSGKAEGPSRPRPCGDQTVSRHSDAIPPGQPVAHTLVDRVDPRSWPDRHPPPSGYVPQRESPLP